MRIAIPINGNRNTNRNLKVFFPVRIYGLWIFVVLCGMGCEVLIMLTTLNPMNLVNHLIVYSNIY